VALLAVNGAGYESGTPTMAALGDLPILQDTLTDDVWTLWGVTYRDVVLVDENNVEVGVFNLTAQDLNDPAYYQALSDLIEAELGP
jgi:hypothetical protein